MKPGGRTFSWKARGKSFGYAFRGLMLLLRREHNVRIHLAALGVNVCLGFWLDISRFEWMLVIFAIGLVFALEAVNTAIEVLADRVSPPEKPDAAVGRVKDVAAGAVLIAALTSLCIGCIVYLPKIIGHLTAD